MMHRKRSIRRLVTALATAGLLGIGLLSAPANADTPTASLSGVASRQEATSGRLPEARPQVVRQPAPLAAAGKDTCTAVGAQRSQRLADGQRYVACIKPGPERPLRTADNHLTA